MHILAEFDKNDGHAGILTKRDGFFPGNTRVFRQLFEDLLALRRNFLRQALRVGFQDIGVQNSGGLDAKLLDGAGDKRGVYFTNGHAAALRGSRLISFAEGLTQDAFRPAWAYIASPEPLRYRSTVAPYATPRSRSF
jgi:hypothetical protein